MTKAVAMANLQVDPAWPALMSEQILTGWRREFCVELLGEGQARVYLRAVEAPSMKADELRRATLFHRVGAGFDDLDGCIAAAREPLEHLARTALRQTPGKDNLFAAVTYDRGAWDRVLQGIEQWQRRPRSTPPRDLSSALKFTYNVALRNGRRATKLTRVSRRGNGQASLAERDDP